MHDNFKIPTGTRESRIKANVMKRQSLKNKWDKHCKYENSSETGFIGAKFSIETFSESNDNFVRLLDEGVVVDGDGYAYAVIAKGTLKAWYNNLKDNFVGTINKDHEPAIDLGKFSKSDLRLVELEGDRYGIDVNVQLDDELYAVKDLKRMMNRKAISSEFYYDASEYITAEAATGDSKQGKFLIPVINEVSITGYAVVDNPKNANSYSETLLVNASADEFAANETSERNDMTEEELKATQAEEVVETEVEAEKVEEPTVEEPATEEVNEEATEEAPAEEVKASAEEPAEEAAEAVEEATEAVEAEAEGEATEEVAEAEGEAEGETAEEEPEISLDKLAAVVQDLKAQLAAKDETIAKLEAKLADSKTKTVKFQNDLEKLFNFAASVDPSEEEGGQTTSANDEKGAEDSYEATLNAAFKNMEG